MRLEKIWGRGFRFGAEAEQGKGLSGQGEATAGLTLASRSRSVSEIAQARRDWSCRASSVTCIRTIHDGSALLVVRRVLSVPVLARTAHADTHVLHTLGECIDCLRRCTKLQETRRMNRLASSSSSSSRRPPSPSSSPRSRRTVNAKGGSQSRSSTLETAAATLNVTAHSTRSNSDGKR
jgi:hypothetical protein